MNNTNKTVIGVVSDFHLRSLHHEILPLYIDNDPSHFRYISTKIKPDDISKTLRFLSKKWAEIDPDHPFDYFFLDESFDLQYRAEEKLGLIFSNFTLLTHISRLSGPLWFGVIYRRTTHQRNRHS